MLWHLVLYGKTKQNISRSTAIGVLWISESFGCNAFGTTPGNVWGTCSLSIFPGSLPACRPIARSCRVPPNPAQCTSCTGQLIEAVLRNHLVSGTSGEDSKEVISTEVAEVGHGRDFPTQRVPPVWEGFLLSSCPGLLLARQAQ